MRGSLQRHGLIRLDFERAIPRMGGIDVSVRAVHPVVETPVIIVGFLDRNRDCLSAPFGAAPVLAWHFGESWREIQNATVGFRTVRRSIAEQPARHGLGSHSEIHPELGIGRRKARTIDFLILDPRTKTQFELRGRGDLIGSRSIADAFDSSFVERLDPSEVSSASSVVLAKSRRSKPALGPVRLPSSLEWLIFP